MNVQRDGGHLEATCARPCPPSAVAGPGAGRRRRSSSPRRPGPSPASPAPPADCSTRSCPCARRTRSGVWSRPSSFVPSSPSCRLRHAPVLEANGSCAKGPQGETLLSARAKDPMRSRRRRARSNRSIDDELLKNHKLIHRGDRVLMCARNTDKERWAFVDDLTKPARWPSDDPSVLRCK